MSCRVVWYLSARAVLTCPVMPHLLCPDEKKAPATAAPVAAAKKAVAGVKAAVKSVAAKVKSVVKGNKGSAKAKSAAKAVASGTKAKAKAKIRTSVHFYRPKVRMRDGANRDMGHEMDAWMFYV